LPVGSGSIAYANRSQVVEDGQNGVVFRSPEELAAKLRCLHALGPAGRKVLGTQARAKIVSQFSYSAVVESISEDLDSNWNERNMTYPITRRLFLQRVALGITTLTLEPHAVFKLLSGEFSGQVNAPRIDALTIEETSNRFGEQLNQIQNPVPDDKIPTRFFYPGYTQDMPPRGMAKWKRW